MNTSIAYPPPCCVLAPSAVSSSGPLICPSCSSSYSGMGALYLGLLAFYYHISAKSQCVECIVHNDTIVMLGV